MSIKNNPIIEVSGLSRHFKMLNRREGTFGALKDLFSRDYYTVKAVEDISFSVQEGEILGFIGPNGAGKSTTIKMLTGVLKESSGTIRCNGYIPFQDRKKYVANIGVVIGHRSQLWWNIPVIESFKVLKDIFRIPDVTYKRNLELINDLIDIKQYYHTPVRKLSLGQKTICDIAATFLHSPKLIFMDEPTIGLDVSVKKKVRQIISALNKELNTTILITSHDMGDIEKLCKRLILIDKGSILYDGATSTFNQAFGAMRTLRMHIPGADQSMLDKMADQLNQSFRTENALTIKSSKEDWHSLTINQDEISMLDLMNFTMKNYPLKDIKLEDISLEEVIIRSYEGELL